MSPSAPAETSLTVEESKQQIERILVLAKLGSDPETIDPLLDTLRIVTAQWDETKPLGPDDQSSLDELEQKLRTHLLHDDSLRRFTPETLNERLRPRQTKHDTAKRDALFILVASAVAAGLPFLLTLFSFPFQKSVLLTIPFFLVTLHAGIAWLYLSALSNFKQEFKRAFILICVGIILLAVVFSHYIAIEFLGLAQLPLFRYGGITALATLCYAFMYFGLRKYAGLLNIKSFFTSLPVLLGVAGVVVAAAVLVPHAKQQAFEPYFDLALACLWLFTMFLAFGAGVAKQITKNVTIAYAKSMHWLYVYLISGCIGSLGGALGLPIAGELNGGFLYILIAAMGIGPQLLLLYTGYLFKKETSA